MEYIAHRINTVEELKKLPVEYGVELDLRDNLGGEVYIQHNPFEKGENFEHYLDLYRHGTMILNIKSERIEFEVLKLLERYQIKSYFFLDSSFPMIYLLNKSGEQNIAIRVSEFEGMDTARNMSGLVKWIWLDCFTKFPIGKEEFIELKKLGYQICLVSPELQGRDEDIEIYKKIIEDNRMEFDAICTKTHTITRWN